MYQRLDEIVLPNGTTYTIIDVVEENNNTYLYLGNQNNDFVLVEVIMDDGKPKLINIDDEDTFKRVVELLLLKNKELLEDVLEEKGE